MSLIGTCSCWDKGNYYWPHFATPKAQCPDCKEWIAWTINRKKEMVE